MKVIAITYIAVDSVFKDVAYMKNNVSLSGLFNQVQNLLLSCIQKF